MPWFIIAAITPVLYSFSNFIDKYLIDKKIKEPLSITVIASIVSGLIGISIGFINGFTNIGGFQICLILFAGVLLSFYLWPYFEALKVEDASRVVPLFQFIPVLTLLLSALILKEILTYKQIIGLVLVVIAGLSLSTERLSGEIFRPRKSLWFMLLASLMYGLVGILFRFVSRDVSFWTTFSYEYMGCGIGGILLLLIPKVRRNLFHDVSQVKSVSGMVTINNGLSILAQLSESYAVSVVAVPLVNLVGSIQPLISLVEGFILTKKFPNFIKEDISKKVILNKLMAVVLIFCGLYLVYF